jgi:hypothetical protein
MSTTTTIRFNCPVCSKPNEQVIPVPDVNWGVEPLGDSLSVDDDVVVCQHCDARDVEDKLNVPGVLYSPAASP